MSVNLSLPNCGVTAGIADRQRPTKMENVQGRIDALEVLLKAGVRKYADGRETLRKRINTSNVTRTPIHILEEKE